MEFDKSRVYTALNADELKVGSKVVASDNLVLLKKRVELAPSDCWPKELIRVDPEDDSHRFIVTQAGSDSAYALAYLVEEPVALKWTDLKPGDVIRATTGDPTLIYNSLHCLVDMIDDDPDTSLHVHAGGRWISNTELQSYFKEA